MVITVEQPRGTPAGPDVPDRHMLWLAPVSIALVLAAVRLSIGDRHLAEMRTALDASRFAEAGAENKAADRWGLHADLWYSRKLLVASGQTSVVMDSIALTQQALTAAIRATRTAEDSSNAWMNLGLIYARLNNAARTDYCIRRAISASPSWYKPHFALSQLLIATGHRDEGEKELKLARDLNPLVPSGH
jgi:hypothetical protein